MIVPMKKVSLVILEKERKETLKSLRKAGVVQLEQVEGSGEVLAQYKDTLNNLMAATSILGELKMPKHFSFQKIDNEQAGEKAKEILSLTDRKKALLDVIATSASEIERLAAWGNVNPSDFTYLTDKKVFLSLYEIPTDKMRLIGDDVKTITVNSTKAITRFIVISEELNTERPQGLPAEAFEVVMPEKSTDDFALDIKKSKEEIFQIDSKIRDSLKYLESMKSFIKDIQKDIEFETYYSGIEKEAESDTALAWFTGFVPIDSIELVKKLAKEEHWALLCDDPTEEDNVPTKLKNNKLVSLIYPLTDFLGTVPGYHEYDISGWFLLFFSIFFAMIFSDAGYGCLFTLIAVIMMIKASSAKKKVHPMINLLLLLGIVSIIWGTLVCSWFGLDLQYIPNFLKVISIPAISSVYNTPELVEQAKLLGRTNVTQNLQIVGFSLALVQLTIAHLKGIKKYIHSPRCLGEFGSMFMLWGMFYLVLSMVVDKNIFSFDKVIYGIPVIKVALGLLGVGFLLNFCFANYENSVGKSILESCKNIISVLLGVVNVFSDIVSYIRLWAVALAGAAISSTVNSMAGPLLGHAIMFIAFLALVLFGHGLNIVLNILSVIVHGVRLNTLEFSTHLGMTWSGYKYEPFSETVNK